MPDKPEFVVLVIGVCLISREGPDDLFRKGFRACFAAVNAQVISGLWIQILGRCLCETGAPVTPFGLPPTQHLDVTADQNRFHLKSGTRIVQGTIDSGAGDHMVDDHRFADLQRCCNIIAESVQPNKSTRCEFISIISVSSMSLSISGRILSLYLDKSALRRADRICGIYCGLASPT